MLQELPLGRVVLRILIGALCVAAAVACYALLGGDFSDTDWKVIATSTLFALTSSLVAAGLSVRERAPVLGATSVASAAAAFVLVSFGMWVELDGEIFWRVTAIIAIVALESAYVAFVWSRLRPTDPKGVARITRAAIGFAVVSAVMGIAPIAGAKGDETLYFELLGVVLVGQVLCTVLAPLVRRLSAGAERPLIDGPSERERLVIELTAVAERLERLDAGPQVSAECERLRRLARTADAL
jgi:peptidoglycan/LPS O-acetylase OafA/YrhL